MSRLWAILQALVRNTIGGLRASPTTGVIATATIALCLLLVGAFAVLVSNMERLLDRFGQEIRVSAYLADGLSVADQRGLLEQVRRIPGVQGVELVTKEQALERFKASASGRATLLEGLDENPLPASLEIALVPARRNAEGLAALAKALQGLPGITDVGYGHEWVEGYAKAVGLLRGIAIAIGGVLSLATLLIVANTIRLSVYARRDEIEILRLVGASRGFIALPFVLEGLVQGFAGGLLALGLLYGLFRLLLPALAGGLELLLGFVTPAFLEPSGAAWLVAAGVILGGLGSAWALAQGRLGT